MPDLRITARLTVPEAALEESFIAASGPGGQNVNKVATAVQLRLHLDRVPDLTERVLANLRALAGRRLGNDGTILLVSREHRTQDRNREAARARLTALLREAAAPPPPCWAPIPMCPRRMRRSCRAGPPISRMPGCAATTTA